MKTVWTIVSTLMLGLMIGSASFAADTGPTTPAAVVDKEIEMARAQIDKEDWTAAIATLEPYTKANTENADGFNLLGYSYRHVNRYDEALAAYKQALTLDPEHRGAHEYIGIAYIELGQLPKAREHLAALDSICFFGCDEYTDLKEALAAAK